LVQYDELEDIFYYNLADKIESINLKANGAYDAAITAANETEEARGLLNFGDGGGNPAHTLKEKIDNLET
jgi:hypothetical protein